MILYTQHPNNGPPVLVRFSRFMRYHGSGWTTPGGAYHPDPPPQPRPPGPPMFPL